MKYTLSLLLFLLTWSLSAQVKPNNFTYEPSPDNSNFEVYSQKNGVNRRASLLALKAYFAPAVNATPILYVPEATGNEIADYGSFVTDPSGDTWYIDMTGRGTLIYTAVSTYSLDSGVIANDTLTLYTSTGTIIIPGFESINTDAQGFTLSDDGTSYTFDLSGTADDFVLREGTNITISRSGDTVTINSTGGSGDSGETNQMLNLGAGAQIFKEKSDTTFHLRTLEDAGIVTITQGTNDITISATEVDGSITNELQGLDSVSLSGDTLYLSLSQDGVPRVATYLGGINTDAQAFSVSDVGANFIFDLSGTASDFTLVEGSNIDLTRSGNSVTINATPGDFGSGTTGRIAAWSADTLRSHIWEITDTYIQGSGTSWPRIEDGFYTFRGDTDTGLKRLAANSLGLFAGSSTNTHITIGNSEVTFPLGGSGTPWYMTASVFGGVGASGPPTLNQTVGAVQHTFSNDTDTGIKRQAADILGIHAGDATNPMIKTDGISDVITLDPDDDGTADVSISATTTTVESLTASGLSTFNGGTRITSHSTFNNKSLLGTDSLNNTTKVILGSEFTQGDGGVYDTLKLSDASKSRLFYGDDLIGSAQVISVGGGSPYDTIVWTTTFQQEQGITYGAPNASTDSAIIFTYPGVYEISYSFTGELAAAATNVSVFAKWNKNGTTAVSGSTASWGFEETNRQHYSGVFQFTAAANDYIQLLMKNSTASASNLSFDTPKVSVKYVAPQ